MSRSSGRPAGRWGPADWARFLSCQRPVQFLIGLPLLLCRPDVGHVGTDRAVVRAGIQQCVRTHGRRGPELLESLLGGKRWPPFSASPAGLRRGPSPALRRTWQHAAIVHGRRQGKIGEGESPGIGGRHGHPRRAHDIRIHCPGGTRTGGLRLVSLRRARSREWTRLAP